MGPAGFEIDFLPVGEGERSGDAIALRYGDLLNAGGRQVVVVVDGGFEADGEAITRLVRQYYGTNYVDTVISTHPDQDHINGLSVVLDELQVGELWMHLPWNRSALVADSRRHQFKSKRVEEKFEGNYASASGLADKALSNGIPIIEPFTGHSSADGCLLVLSPSEIYYQLLLDELDGGRSASTALGGVLSGLAAAAQKLVPESLDIETLTDWGETSPQNNSSVISLLRVGEYAALLTGDAGMPALSQAAHHLESLGLTPGRLDFVQVPHHGSRRNVGPTVLNRLLGPKGVDVRVGSAFVSAAEKSDKHPAAKVTNAFRRRGYPVVGTDGQTICFSRNSPSRPGWSAVEPYPLKTQVPSDEG